MGLLYDYRRRAAEWNSIHGFRGVAHIPYIHSRADYELIYLSTSLELGSSSANFDSEETFRVRKKFLKVSRSNLIEKAVVQALNEGDLLMNLGKLKEALPYYDKVIDNLPFQSELHGLAALQWSICQDSLNRYV
ncbi:hypothetical protein HN873_051291 [Arachis hypogaea]